jgi:hypothetical protein
MSNLRLIGSNLFSTRKDPNVDRVVEAHFFVDAHDADHTEQPPATYMLTALTSDAYDAWSVERQTRGGPNDVEDIYPLVVSPSLLVSRGLVEFVQNTYLDPGRPEAVAHIAQFLLYVESAADHDALAG